MNRGTVARFSPKQKWQAVSQMGRVCRVTPTAGLRLDRGVNSNTDIVESRNGVFRGRSLRPGPYVLRICLFRLCLLTGRLILGLAHRYSLELRPEKSLGRSSRIPTAVGNLSGHRIAEFGEIRKGVRDDVPEIRDFSGHRSITRENCSVASDSVRPDELHIWGSPPLPPDSPSRARPTGSPDRWPHLIIRCGGAYARAHKAVRLDLTGSPNKECLTSSSRRGTASQPRFRRTGPAASRRRSSAERTERGARLD